MLVVLSFALPLNAAGRLLVYETQSGSKTTVTILETGNKFKLSYRSNEYYIDQQALYTCRPKNKDHVERLYLNKAKKTSQIPLFPILVNLNKKIRNNFLKSGVKKGNCTITNMQCSNSDFGMTPCEKRVLKIYQEKDGVINKIEEFTVEDKEKPEKLTLKQMVIVKKNRAGIPEQVIYDLKATTEQEDVFLRQVETAVDKIQLPLNKLMVDIAPLSEKEYLGRLKENPREINSLFNLGKLCNTQNQIGKSIKYLTRAWEQQPFNAAITSELFRTYISNGRFVEAKKFVQKNEKSSMATAYFYRRAGFMYGLIGKRQLEEKYYLKAVDLSVDKDEKIDNFFALAKMYISRQRFKDAKLVLDKIAILNSDKLIINRIKQARVNIDLIKKRIHIENQNKLRKGYEKLINSKKLDKKYKSQLKERFYN